MQHPGNDRERLRLRQGVAPLHVGGIEVGVGVATEVGAGLATERPIAAGRATGARTLPQVPALDGLRGIAVVLVMLLHLRLLVPRFGWMFVGGFVGVDLFFVLSGFLITSLLLAEHARDGRISLRSFYARRARRLLPALVLFLAVHVAYTAALGRDLGLEARTVVSVLLYILNWVAASGEPLALGLGHLWSLSVEEQFYLLWPVVMMVILSREPTRRHALVAVVAATTGLAVWTALVWEPGTGGFGVASAYVRTDTHAVPVLCGAAAAFVWSRHRLPPRPLRALAWLSIAFIGACALRLPVTSAHYYEGAMALIGISGAVVVLAAAEGDGVLARLLSWRPLRGLGRVSYGLYLWHVPVILEVSLHAGALPPAIRVLVALSITAACAAASWHFVEAPFLKRSSASARSR